MSFFFGQKKDFTGHNTSWTLKIQKTQLKPALNEHQSQAFLCTSVSSSGFKVKKKMYIS